MIEDNTWSTSLQKPLLQAAFLSNETGIQAWELWKSGVNMEDHPDLGSFRLLPQLYHNLHSLGIYDPIMMKLKGIARQNWYQNQQFFRNVAPLLRALHEASIACLLLNGPAIALHYYSEYALGPEKNLAILVRAKQVCQAMERLQHLGWQPEKQIPDGLLEPYLAAAWRHVFQDTAGRRIHLHWGLPLACCMAEGEADFGLEPWSRRCMTCRLVY